MYTKAKRNQTQTQKAPQHQTTQHNIQKRQQTRQKRKHKQN
jgi:hypothetical protein